MKNLMAILLVAAAVSRLAADAPAPVAVPLGAYAAPLKAPARVAADAAGYLYVTDPQAGQLAVFDAFGRPVGALPGLGAPLAVAVDARGYLYLSDGQSGSVSVFDAQRNFKYQLGAGAGEFQMPNHLACDPAAPGTVYVSDSKANLIKVYDGAAPVRQFGGAGTSAGLFNFPAGLCVSAAGEVFVVDQNNDRVQVCDRAGNFQRQFSLGGSAFSPSGRSQAAVLDNAGRLYVADTFQGAVKVFDAATGAALARLGGFGDLPGQLASPAGLALDAQNRLFVASANNGRVELFGLDAFVQLTAQPANGVVSAGGDLVLSVSTGTTEGTTCQWLKNGEVIAGATNNTLHVAGATAADSGSYSVVVTGPGGTFASSVAPVTVMAPPAIVSSPQDLRVVRGSNVTFTVGTVGEQLSYQWQLNGLNLEGATNNSLALPEVQTFQAGAYSVVVKNAAGQVGSTPATLTVLVPPTYLQIFGGEFGADQLFHFTLAADIPNQCAIDISSDLRQWAPLVTNQLSADLFEFTDLSSTNAATRTYRLRWAP